MHGRHRQQLGTRASQRLRLVAATALAVAGLAASAQAATALSITDASLRATEGIPFTGQVGTFDGTLLFCSQGDYTATVDWGDGTMSNTDVTQSGTCSFTVSSLQPHTFAEETLQGGAQPHYTLTVSGPLFGPASAQGSATVADADLTAGPPLSLQGTTGMPVSGVLATFSDANPNAPASDFSAHVDWGDGTATAATVAAGSGHFDVAATHTYASDGAHVATISVSDAVKSTSNTATITTAPARSPSPSPGGGSGATSTSPTPSTHPSPPSQIVLSADAVSGPPPRVFVSTPRYAGRGAVQLSVRCPTPGTDCRGIVRLLTRASPGIRGRYGHAGVQLGSAVFLLHAGDSETLDISLPRIVRQLLAHRRRIRAQAIATAFSATGDAASATAVVALRRRR